MVKDTQTPYVSAHIRALGFNGPEDIAYLLRLAECADKIVSNVYVGALPLNHTGECASSADDCFCGAEDMSMAIHEYKSLRGEE